MKGITACAECAYYDMKNHKCTRGCTKDPDISKGDDVRFYVDCHLPDAESVIRCKDCVYYHKAHIKRKDGTECDISEVPEGFVPIPGMCNSDYGINVGGKCEYDNDVAPYVDDKTVFRSENDFCSRGRKKDGGAV